MKHIKPPKTAKLFEFNAFVDQRNINLNSRIIVDTTSFNCEDSIVLSINEFPDIRYPEFEYKKPTFELMVLCGRDLTDIEKNRLFVVFDSFLRVNKQFTVLENIRFVWDGANCHGITFYNFLD